MHTSTHISYQIDHVQLDVFVCDQSKDQSGKDIILCFDPKSRLVTGTFFRTTKPGEHINPTPLSASMRPSDSDAS